MAWPPIRISPALLAVGLALGDAPAQAPEEPREARASPEPPNAGSAPGWDEATLRDHADDVVDYTLYARLDPVAHTLHAEGTIVWRNASRAPVQELWLHLYMNAFKNERSLFLRERIGGRGSARPDDWGWIDVQKLAMREAAPGGGPVDLWAGAERTRPGDDDETDARVPLPRSVGPGEEITLEVAFDERLPEVIERTGHHGSFHMVGQWFPKIARLEPDGRWAHFPFHHLSEFYADFGTYDVTLDVPEAFTIGATGPVASSRVEGGRRIERHVQRDVHDFAWTAWDAFRTARERIDGVDVVLLYPPGYGAMARRELAALRFALPYESARYGRYPYGVLTVVHPPLNAAEAGGMEYPTLITTGGAWWTPAGVLAPEIVTVHELGHQWFYGLVATDEHAWPMLDEGLNQYAEVDAMGRWRGAGSAVDVAGLRVSDAAVQATLGNMGVHDEPVAQAADAFSGGASYQRLVYARTASVVATLARVYGDDAVARALGLYTRRHRFDHPGPEQLLACFAEVLGERAAADLRTALFGEGWVDYLVDRIRSEPAETPAGVFDRDGKRDRVSPEPEAPERAWDNSVLVRRRGTLTFPVDVELTMADGSRTRERWDGEGQWKRFEWRGPVALRGATIDPDDRVLIDADLANNGRAMGRATGGWLRGRPSSWPPRSLERLTYAMELAAQWVSP